MLISLKELALERVVKVSISLGFIFARSYFSQAGQEFCRKKMNVITGTQNCMRSKKNK
jgi:hypothetical protein